MRTSQRLVHGHINRTQIQDREIHHVPLGTIVREQQNAISRFHSELEERVRQRTGLGEELLGREHPPTRWRPVGIVLSAWRFDLVAVDIEDGTVSHRFAPVCLGGS